MSSSVFTSAVNMSFVCSARSAGVSISRRVVLKPATMASRSASSPRKFGSMRGAASGSAEPRLTLPRLFGLSRQTWQEKPVPRWRLRPWSSTIAMPKCSWMSGTSRSGRVFRKPPHSAKLVVIGPRRSRRYCAMPRNSRGRPFQRRAEEVRVVGHVAEDEIRMVLQVLSDARQVMHAGNAVLRQSALSPTPDSMQQLRRLERAGGQDHLAPRADRLCLLALHIFDADRALALEQDVRGACANVSTRRLVRLSICGCT